MSTGLTLLIEEVLDDDFLWNISLRTFTYICIFLTPEPPSSINRGPEKWLFNEQLTLPMSAINTMFHGGAGGHQRRAHQIHQQTIRGGTGRWRLELLQRNLPGTNFWRLNSLVRYGYTSMFANPQLMLANQGASVLGSAPDPVKSSTRSRTQGETWPASLTSWKQ